MEIAKIIDHTNLKPEAADVDIKKLCFEAKKYGFRAVCVNLNWVSFCIQELKDTNIKVVGVVDFPLGAGGRESRIEQAKIAKKLGAMEIDIVISFGDFKSGNYNKVLADLEAVSKILPTKVIIETGLLNDEEIKKASEIVKESGAFCVKTSTGFIANIDIEKKIEHVKIMRKAVGQDFCIKAAGGIKTKEEIDKLIEAGANIIGASASVEIIQKSQISGSK